MALALILAPLAAADDAFAGKKNKKDNFAQQIISQVQKSSQNSQVVSGGNSIGSGNNINFQFQSNSGNNALAQSND
jgi:CHASE3 domain sensor protein